MIELNKESQEEIILNKFYHDAEFRHIILDNYQKDFFDNSALDDTLNIIIQFYKKFEEMPSRFILSNALGQMAKRREIDEKVLISKVNHSLDLKLENENNKVLKDIVLNFTKHRLASITLFEAAGTVDEKDQNLVEKTVTDCIDRFTKIININFEDELGFDYFDKIAQEIHWNYLQNPEAKLSTGYDCLDYATNGGIPKNGKCLMTIMAPPGLGKSLMLLNLGVNFLQQGKFVVIFSLEMSEQMYGARATSIISHEDINRLKDVSEKAKNKIWNYHNLHPEAKLIIKEYPPDTINCLRLQNDLDRIIAKCGRKPDVIIVDYVNLLLASKGRKDGNSYEKVGNATRELRAMSYKYNAPVITATQNNRMGVENSQDVGMNNISDSMGIAHTSDWISNLYQKEGDKDRGIINMGILKNRFGSITNKSYEFAINYSNLKITNMSKEDLNDSEDYVDPTDLNNMLENLN